MDLSNFNAIIEDAAKKHELDANLIRAIIMQESSGNPWAMRIEPKWKYFVFVRTSAENLRISFDTETACQAISWGLMQIMGSVARELGYKDHLAKLLDPVLGIEWGCKKLKSQLVRYGNEDDAIAAYNAGSVIKTQGGQYVNMGYHDGVCRFLRDLRKLK